MLSRNASELRQRGDMDGALRTVERGLNATRHDRSEWYWKLFLQRAEILQQKSGSNAALAALSEEPPPEPRFAELRARQKQDQAYAYFVLGKYSEAAAMLDESSALAVSSHDRARIASVRFLEGQVLIRMGNPQLAEQRIRDGADLARTAGNDEVTAYGLSSLALLLMNQSRFEDALQALEQEQALIKAGYKRGGLSGSLNNMGWCHYRLGEFDRALADFSQAEKVASDADDQMNRHIALGQSGNVYLDQHKLVEAQRNYERAAAISAELKQDFWTSRWLANLARVSIQQRDWARASAYNLRALTLKRQLKDTTAELYSHVISAQIAQGQGKRAEAEATFLRVAHTGSEDPAPELEAHAGLAELYSGAGQLAQAEAEYEAAFRAIEKARSAVREDEARINFLSSLMEVHQSYVEFLMSHGRTERALEVAEASRARTLRERLGTGRNTQPLTAAGYRKLARDRGATLLSYWLGPKCSYVWVTTPRQISAYRLPPEDRVLALVRDYLAVIEAVHDPLATGAGTQLYAAVLGPIQPPLKPGTHLIVAPDRALNGLNLETLPTPGAKPHYFIEDAVISVAPSLNLLASSASQRFGNPRLLLIGDPESSDEHYPKLPYAGKEIELVSARFRPEDVTCFRNQAAAPEAYKSSAGQRFGFVHFTAHAIANRESPLDSAIMLSGPRGANLLSARDVLKYSSTANVVTLSACRAAGAQVFAGEGLVGFMWAFFQAGAQNVIAGLWDVSDDSTPQLMDKLYAGLLGGQPAAEALRTAKLDVMRSNQTYRLPYYWGPFQLYVR